jgi:hypothetical protein
MTQVLCSALERSGQGELSAEIAQEFLKSRRGGPIDSHRLFPWADRKARSKS